MAKLLKLRRGNTSAHSSFAGAEGEVTVDTDKETLVVHNGSTNGGFPLLRASGGDQNISTTGTISSNNITISDTNPKINFTDSDHNPDFSLQVNSGAFAIHDETNSTNRLQVNSDGHVDVNGNLDVGAGIDVTGNITTTGEIEITGSTTVLKFTENDANPDFGFLGNGGLLRVQDLTNTANIMVFGPNNVQCIKNLDLDNGLDVTGNITVTGTVDGVDVASLNTTVGGNLTTSNIASNAQIALSKLETITSNRIVGNDSGNAVPKELTAAEVRTIINVEDGATADQTAEEIQDIVGAMLSGNTESGITVTYQDGDGTIDFSVASQTDQNFTTTLKNKLDGIASGATNVTNNNQLTNGAGYITSASFSDVAGGGTFTGDVTFNGNAAAVTIGGGGDIRLNSGGWTGDYACKIQNHDNVLYIQGGSNASKSIIFRDNGGGDRWYITQNGHLIPQDNNSYDIGSSSNRVQHFYTNDLHLSNKGHSNDVDGTWGDWTIQEGESDLFLKNNRSGKKYKFNLTEVS